MFGIFKKRKQNTELVPLNDNTKEENDKSNIKTAAALTAAESARRSADQARITFSKPASYTGNRQLYDSGAAKRGVKMESFSGGSLVKDPYTQDVLELKISDAKMKYGNDWQKHVAEGDHITPIEKIFDANKKNPFLRNEDIKEIANSKDNLQTVSRKFNNAKRNKPNEEFVTDDEYLNKTDVNLSPSGKEQAIETGRKSQQAIDKKIRKASAKNFLKTGHDAGKAAAKNAGVTTATMSGIMNITAVIKGEKTAEDAVADIVVDTGKAAATGYVMGNGLTTISQSLSSSSGFLGALSESNIPGKVITAVMVTGETLKRYGKGEISTQECILELGEKGVGFAATTYSMAVGQALIPIPIVGGAVGALVGSVLSGKYCGELMDRLKSRELEHQERQRIIAEYEIAASQARAFRMELEEYLSAYFEDYQNCFDEALSEIRFAFETGDAEGIVAGANQITRQLGGTVEYETYEEFKEFLMSDEIDEF